MITLRKQSFVIIGKACTAVLFNVKPGQQVQLAVFNGPLSVFDFPFMHNGC